MVKGAAVATPEAGALPHFTLHIFTITHVHTHHTRVKGLTRGAGPKKPNRVAAPSPRASLGLRAVCGRTEQRRPPVSKRYETKIRMVWGGGCNAAAALKTPTRNGYNAKGVNLTIHNTRTPTTQPSYLSTLGRMLGDEYRGQCKKQSLTLTILILYTTHTRTTHIHTDFHRRFITQRGHEHTRTGT